nr:hypothetical protein [Tanacetum cinerariifolium]
LVNEDTPSIKKEAQKALMFANQYLHNASVVLKQFPSLQRTA